MESIREHTPNKDMSSTTPAATPPSRRGFAGMAADKHRSISSTGGKTAHAQQRAHEFSSEEARRAGRLGGERVSRNREHMAAIGRKGGRANKGAARSSAPLSSAYAAAAADSAPALSAGPSCDASPGNLAEPPERPGS